jgi:hypothetical protein
MNRSLASFPNLLCASKYDEHSKSWGAPCSGGCSFLLCNEFFRLCLLQKKSNQIKSKSTKMQRAMPLREQNNHHP